MARAYSNLALGVGEAARVRVVGEDAEEGVGERFEVFGFENVLVVEDATAASVRKR